MTFTSPTGHGYTTQPAGTLLYPALSGSTGDLDAPARSGPHSATRGLAMPTRKRSRDQERQLRVARERRMRADINAAAYPLPAAEPPPF